MNPAGTNSPHPSPVPSPFQTHTSTQARAPTHTHTTTCAQTHAHAHTITPPPRPSFGAWSPCRYLSDTATLQPTPLRRAHAELEALAPLIVDNLETALLDSVCGTPPGIHSFDGASTSEAVHNALLDPNGSECTQRAQFSARMELFDSEYSELMGSRSSSPAHASFSNDRHPFENMACAGITPWENSNDAQQISPLAEQARLLDLRPSSRPRASTPSHGSRARTPVKCDVSTVVGNDYHVESDSTDAFSDILPASESSLLRLSSQPRTSTAVYEIQAMTMADLAQDENSNDAQLSLAQISPSAAQPRFLDLRPSSQPRTSTPSHESRARNPVKRDVSSEQVL